MNKFLKIVIGAVAFLLVAFISFVLFETKDEIKAKPHTIAARLNEYYNEIEMAGFAVSVFNADSVIYQGAVGYADVKNKIPYTTATHQYIASISKSLIGVCLLKAQELGLLSLDDPINNFLPLNIANPAFPERPILIKHLATHTSSLDYNEEVVESLYIDKTEEQESLSNFINNYFAQRAYGEVMYTEDAPGDNWNYSNIGSGLAAYIIERVAGQSFAQFSRQHIFEPLGMQTTDWFTQVDSTIHYTKYYEPQEDGNINEFATSGITLYPCRDLATNVEELTKYAQAIIKRDQKLLTPASYQSMLAPALSNSVKNQEVDNHGIFWMIDRNNYGITYQLTGMNGGDNCINTMMWFDPVTQMGYIFLGNTGKSAQNFGNHIWLFRTLVSLSDHVLMNDPNNSLLDKMYYKWHNVYSRLGGLF